MSGQMEQREPTGHCLCSNATILLSNPFFRRRRMNGVIYIVGLIVVIMAILSFFGLR